jgi:hypothetical protein
MKHKTNTVRMTNDQAAEIMSALDHYRTMGECSYPKTRDAFREHVHIQTLCHDADGETFDIVPPPPPSEHTLLTVNGGMIVAVLGCNRKADDSFGITSNNWMFEAADCDEAAEWFQMLARQLRERE